MRLTVEPLAVPDSDGDGCAGVAVEGGGVADIAALYRAESPRLLRLFRRRTADSVEAQDLVQETFTRALGVAPGAAIRKPQAYLTRVAHNLLRDRAKTRVRRSAAAHVPADDANLAGTDQICLLETRDLLDRLDRAMLELPKETREIFMAHRIEGLSYAEIAERTGLTSKQIEWAIARSMIVLDRTLGPR